MALTSLRVGPWMFHVKHPRGRRAAPCGSVDEIPHANLSEAYYLQANAAYTVSADDVVASTPRPRRGRGPYKTQAQELYADAWLWLNDYQRAKDIYALRSMTFTGADRPRIIKKIKQCNAKPGVP